LSADINSSLVAYRHVVKYMNSKKSFFLVPTNANDIQITKDKDRTKKQLIEKSSPTPG